MSKSAQLAVVAVFLALVAAVVAFVFTGAPAPVKMMSFNIHHGEGADGKIDLARIAAAIVAERPDFVGVQEVDVRTLRSGGVDQAAEIARLAGMHSTFARGIVFKGGEYGVMVLSREKPLAVHTARLPGAEPRVLLLCEFADCWFGTTHLSVAAESERAESVQIIRDAVAARTSSKPVYLTGDWNSNPSSSVLASLRQFLTVLSREDLRTFHGFKDAAPDGAHCIDYIAVDAAAAARVVAQDARVVADLAASDHFPIVVTVAPR